MINVIYLFLMNNWFIILSKIKKVYYKYVNFFTIFNICNY